MHCPAEDPVTLLQAVPSVFTGQPAANDCLGALLATTLGFWYFMFVPSEAVASFVASPPLPAPAGLQRQNGFFCSRPHIAPPAPFRCLHSSAHASPSGCNCNCPSNLNHTKCTCAPVRGGVFPTDYSCNSRKTTIRKTHNGLHHPCVRACPMDCRNSYHNLLNRTICISLTCFIPSEAVATFVASPPSPAPAGL